MSTLIIEVSGGVVREVYTDAEDLRAILVDWDAGESPGDEFAGGKLPVLSLLNLPKQTIEAAFALTA